jgi:hypothetical protein
MLSNSSIDEPQSLPIEHAQCLTTWFQYLITHCKISQMSFLCINMKFFRSQTSIIKIVFSYIS